MLQNLGTQMELKVLRNLLIEFGDYILKLIKYKIKKFLSLTKYSTILLKK